MFTTSTDTATAGTGTDGMAFSYMQPVTTTPTTFVQLENSSYSMMEIDTESQSSIDPMVTT